MSLNKNTIYTLLALQLLLFDLVYFLVPDLLISKAIILCVLLILPGSYLLLSFRINEATIAERVGLTVGLSIAFLMVIGLVANTILPLFDSITPLSSINIFGSFNIGVLVLWVLSRYRTRRTDITYSFRLESTKYLLLFTIPVLFPLFSIVGAISLNNNVSSLYTLLMLIGSGMFIIFLVIFRKVINSQLIPFTLYFIAVSLLLMTSLRGSYTTGHDNQLEFFVFQLTESASFWDISKYRDPYNASLSITILPTVFKSMLNIPSEYVYKVVYQLLFGLISVNIFVLYRKFTDTITSFLAAIVFISFPSFMTDMPMLNRQEIALLFFSLMIVVLFTKSISRRSQIVLFSIFGFSMALSHYSTTYIALGIFIGLFFLSKTIRLIFTRTLGKLGLVVHEQKLTLPLIILLASFTFIWNFQITKTTEGLQRVISEVIVNINQLQSHSLKSGEIFYFLLGGSSSRSDEELLEDYYTENFDELRMNKEQDLFYSLEEVNNFPIQIKDKLSKPITSLGELMASSSLPPDKLIYSLRQGSAKVIQLLIVIGFLMLITKNIKRRNEIDPEFVLLSGIGIGTIALFLLLPVLSIEYGTQRLFQQILIILGFLVIFGIYFGAKPLFKQYSKLTTAIVVTFFFLLMTGVIPQITGGYRPQLHLNNYGIDYDAYYVHDSEYLSAQWLKEEYGREFDIYTTSPTRSKLTAMANIFAYDTILPAVIRKDGYVYLDYYTSTFSTSIISYNGDLLQYTYPIEFLNINKDLIYSNKSTKIYK